MSDTTNAPDTIPAPAKGKRGFALLSPERRRELAAIGGKAAQAAGRGHRYTSDEAKLAGRLGGLAVSADREHMSRIGTIGGKTSKRRSKLRAREEGSAG